MSFFVQFLIRCLVIEVARVEGVRLLEFHLKVNNLVLELLDLLVVLLELAYSALPLNDYTIESFLGSFQ